MEELFRSWGVTNAATQEMVARRYIERMVGCIANVTSSKCTLSGKEQRAEIRTTVGIYEGYAIAYPVEKCYTCLDGIKRHHFCERT